MPPGASTARDLLHALANEPWLAATISELSTHSSRLSSLLQQSFSDDSIEALAAASALLDTLWSRAKTEVGWGQPVWREAFVVASVCAAVAGSNQVLVGDAKLALRRLDEAFIMGGPAEILQPFVDKIEPLVVSTEADTCGDNKEVGGAATVLAPKLPPFVHAVPRLQDPTASQFSEFFRADLPCCIAGADIADNWPALRIWHNWGWWTQRYGHRHVPLEVGAFNDPAWHEEVASMADFVDRLCAGVEIVYLAQHTLFDQLPDLKGHFSEPTVVRGRVTRINAWIGSANTVTPCHFDSYDGVLCQVVGYKHVRLFPPNDSKFLYPTSTSWTAQRRWPANASETTTAMNGRRTEPHGTISLVDVAAPDMLRFPLFDRATCSEVLLGPGDALFIPAGWWHWVRAVDRSISVSFVL